jgi:hypothetical protein
MIGQAGTFYRTVTRLIRRSSYSPTRDWGRSDYAFWDKARRGKALGLELSGLFLKPLASKIAAWTLGRRPQWRLDNTRSQEALNDWWNDNHASILRAWREAVGLGDHFLVINSDLTPTVVPPHVVDPLVSDTDYTEIVGWRITEVIPHPERAGDTMRITDEYTATERVRTVEIGGKMLQTTRYPNLLGLTAVIHIPNLNGSDEIFGRPEGEPLVPALHRYNDILEAAVEGNILQGRSTPTAVFQTKEDLDTFWNRNAETMSRELPDGTTETYQELEFDSSKFLALSGATFDYKSPSSFSQDTERLLGLFFYLILQHTEIPEFIWGNAIASSKASAESQLEPFITYIDMRRGDMAKWLTQIAEVVLAYLSLTEPGVVQQTPRIQWEKLTDQDGNLTLSTVQWAYSEGLLDARTALMLAPVDVEDIDTVLAQAQKEAEEAQAQQQADMEAAQKYDAFQAEVARLEAGGD